MSEAKLQELFDRHDPSAEPPMPAGYVQDTLAHGRRRVRRRTAGFVATSGVAAVAVLAVGGSMLVSGGSTPGRGPASHQAVAAAPASAAALLDRVSLAAYHETVAVRPDQFIYIADTNKSREPVPGADSPELHAEGADGAIPKGVRTEVIVEKGQSWISADGSKAGGFAASVRLKAGQIYPGTTNPRPSMADPTYEYLTTLPTDPAALMVKIRAAAQATADVKPGQQKLVDYFAFEKILSLVNTGILPSRLAGALYTDLSRLPKVTLVRDTTDAVGRHGMAVAMTDPINGARKLMIFDPKTFRYLGSRTEETATGRFLDWDAIVKTGVVDRVGQLPR